MGVSLELLLQLCCISFDPSNANDIHGERLFWDRKDRPCCTAKKPVLGYVMALTLFKSTFENANQDGCLQVDLER